MISETPASREASLQGRLTFLDAGPDNAKMLVYGGTRPENSSLMASSEVLCELVLTKPAGSIASGQLSLTQQGEGLILRTGIATWVRVTNGQGQTAFDLDAGPQEGTAEAKFTSVQLYAGGGLRLLSAVLS